MEIENRILALIKENFTFIESGFTLSAEQPLSALGVNSLSYIKMITIIEAEFDMEFDDDDLDYRRFENIKALAAFVGTKIDGRQEADQEYMHI